MLISAEPPVVAKGESRLAANDAQGGSAPAGGFGIPSNCSMSFGESGPGGEGKIRIGGYVDILCGDTRIQADTVIYDPRTQRGEAEGNVVLDWGSNRITGSRLEFDLAHQTGAMADATGWLEPDAIMSAQSISKIDEDHVLLEKGRFTTCTQPIPYWSFRVGRGVFHLKHYAHLRNVRLNVGRVPVFYLPYLLWPIKGDRAAGFLFPQWGTSKKFGFFAGDAFFLPLARNADATFYGDYYKNAGPAGGLEVNWLPDARGRVRLTGYYLKDNVRNQRRYMARLQSQQGLGRGWRLTTDINQISDFQYHQDFDRNLATASTNSNLSTIDLVRNGEFTSLNTRVRRSEQFTPTGTVDVFPEVELRGRSRNLPGTPIYFSFESSAQHFRKVGGTFDTLGCRDQRLDCEGTQLSIVPHVAVPLHPFPWLAFEGRATFSESYETVAVRSVPDGLKDRAGFEQSSYDLEGEIAGPKLYRIYESSSAFSSVYKHVIEPRVIYHYRPQVDRPDASALGLDLTPIEGFSASSSRLNLVSVVLTNRLLAKRPAQLSPPGKTSTPDASTTSGTLPWSSFPAPIEAPPPALAAALSLEEGADASVSGSSAPVSSPLDPMSKATESELPPARPAPSPAQPAQINPVEIASLEISQPYSFDAPLSRRYGSDVHCADGTKPPPCANGLKPVPDVAGTKNYGLLSVALHFNPLLSFSVDLRSDFDLANSTFASNSLSGWYRWKLGYINATFSRLDTAADPNQSSSQLRLGTGAGFFNRKLTLDGDLGYDLRSTATLDRRARVGYYTQCCGFVVEYLQRDFQNDARREFRFVVDLKGIGKFLDLGGVSTQ